MFEQAYSGVDAHASKFCIACHSSCASGCQGAGPADCIDGASGLCVAYQYKTTCVESCPTGTYAADSDMCKPCHSECDAQGLIA